MSTERPRINVVLRSEQSGGQLAVMDNVCRAAALAVKKVVLTAVTTDTM